MLLEHAPPCQFSPRISATSFCKYDKTFFVKFCRKKNVNMPSLLAPDMQLGGGGHVPPVPPVYATVCCIT